MVDAPIGEQTFETTTLAAFAAVDKAITCVPMPYRDALHEALLAAIDRYEADLIAATQAAGSHIHHIDGNPYNNEPSNLKLIHAMESGGSDP